MKLHYLTIAAALLATPHFSGAVTSLPQADKSFAEEAAQGGMTEVKMGKLAEEKSSNPEIKKFGQTLEADHSKANGELKSVADKKGLTLPGDISSDQRKHLETLGSTDAKDFDRDFVQHMVKDHKEDIAKFEKEASSGQDREIKSFAEKALPVLKGHLQIAESLAAKMGSSEGRGRLSGK